MEWTPGEGMRTVAGQRVEIIAIEIPLVTGLREGMKTPDAEIDKFIGEDMSLAALRLRLTDVRQQTLTYLDLLSENDLAEEVSYGGGWFGSFWQPMLPRAEVILNVAEHEFYHVGQLTSYLWFRGDDSFQW